MFATMTSGGRIVLIRLKGFDVLLSIALICGVGASLALGVLIAYGLLIGMFSAFRVHSQQVAAARVAARPQVAMTVAENS